MAPITVLPLLGSLREGSYNRLVLRAARSLAPAEMTIAEHADLSAIPLYDQDLMDASGFPTAVVALREAIAAADAVLFVSPEYNYSIPGVLKNAIDWASRGADQPFKGKPAGVMGASPGLVGTARMQYHLRQVMVFLEMHPINKPEVIINAVHTRFDESGALTDAMTAQVITSHLEALDAWTRRLCS